MENSRMKIISINQLNVGPDRIRKEFNSVTITELADSILSKGLLHPPVVKYNSSAMSYDLIAGERRVRAIQVLYSEDKTFMCNGEEVALGHLPVVYIGSELSDIALLEAELEENTKRVDLSWQEKDTCIAKLHELRNTTTISQTYTKTAEELNNTNPEFLGSRKVNATYVKDSVLLADHMKDPLIGEAKSREEALKRLAQKRAAELRSLLADRAAERGSRHSFYNESFIDHEFPEQGSISVVVTDPPYGINADKFNFHNKTPEASNILAHTYDDSPEMWHGLMQKLFQALSNGCRDSAHAYIFCAFERFSALHDIGRDAGWKIWPRPLIWSRRASNSGSLPVPNYGPRYVYDCILFANRGNKPTVLTKPDVLDHNPVRVIRRQAQKPSGLYQDLLSRSAVPGDIVWDPFCGTGPIFKAAQLMTLTAVGHEIDEDALNIAKTTYQDPD